ncbi:hypothetical protein GOODEAATRI_018712, partial [Goodea atripinnis]
PEFSHPSLVRTALSALASVGASFQYPPVNWSAHRTRAHLYETLSMWMKHVAEDKLQVYVQSLGLQQFQDDVRAHRLSLCQSLLQGLAQAMVLPNPPNHCWTILCSTAEKIFSLLPSQIQMEKSCFVLAYLTSQGRVPLLSLNDVIAGVLRGWPSCRVGWILLQTFYQCRLAASTNTGVSRRMEWLLELMGHIRNIGYGATSVTCGETKLATDFLFQLFAAAVISWGDHFMPLLFGIRPQWFPWQPDSKPPMLTHSLYAAVSLTDLALPQCLLGVSHSLPLLLGKEPWSSQTHKVRGYPDEE